MPACYCPAQYHLDRDAAAHDRRGPLQTRQREFIFSSEKTIHLRPARLEQRGHSVLRDFLFFHGFRELPGYDLLHSLRLRLFENALLLEKGINTRTHVFLAHCSSSFLRFRANAKSSSGVARVFLITPCSATSCSR